jgi:ABC-type spermidine/putrescine transport system permease subunit II
MFDALRVFVPYLIFAAAVWKLAKNKPYRTLIFLAFVVPIIWGIFFTLCYMPYSYFKEKLLDWYILCIMGFWATFVAYFAEVIPYVILVTFKDVFQDAPMTNRAVPPLDHSPASPERP